MSTLTIIGGGPAGYVAAIVAAQRGKKVTLIEEKEMGGTCLNEGCIPTKALLESSEVYQKVMNAKNFGVDLSTDHVKINWDRVQNYKNTTIKKLTQGVHYLMKKNKIKILKGRASFLTENRIVVNSEDKLEEIDVQEVIIATGSEPVSLPFAPFDQNWVIDSRQAMSLTTIPSSLLIIGGGVIGCEFASIYSRMGTKVTIVEMVEQLLPSEDADIVLDLQKELEKNGVAVYTSSSLKQLNSEKKEAIIENDQGIHNIHADYVIVSIGRKPRIDGLNLEQIGVIASNKGIEVNNHMQTNIPHIYACGDVIGGIQLAHVAFHEGTVAALHACGEDMMVNYRAVPRCIYTFPEVASVGMTEKQARMEYGDIRIGEFSFTGNGKAIIMKEQIGKVKVIVEPRFNEIIGVSIVGPNATELIGQAAVMLHNESTIDIMEDFIAPHPTLSESIHEAMLSTIGHYVHS